MLFSSFLRNGNRSAPAARRRMQAQTSTRQRLDVGPRLEVLEDRCLFSTLTVTNLQDSGVGSLRAQIAAAQSGDTIVFASTLSSTAALSNSTTLSRSSSKNGHGKPTAPPPPTPPSPPTITLTSGELLLNRNVTVQGPGAAQLVISGNNVSRAFEVAQGTTVTLSGLTINGSSSYWTTYPVVTPWAGDGGGILNHGTLTISACTVSGAIYSSIGQGGGIFNDGTLNVSGSTVSNCRADGSAGGDPVGYGASGAGIANLGTATLTNTIISNNRATETTSYPWFNQGGGIYNEGTLALAGCTVSGNYSQHEAGGIFNAGTLILSSTTLSGNSAGGDGSSVSNYGTMTVKSSSHIDAVNNLNKLYLENSTSTIGILTGNRAILI